VKNLRAILLSVVTVANASAAAVTQEVGWPVIDFFEPSVSLPSSVLDLRLIVLRGTHNMPFSESLTLFKIRIDKNRLGPVGYFGLFERGSAALHRRSRNEAQFSAVAGARLQRIEPMKAVLPLTFAGLVGLGGVGAMAQTAPGDPAGNQTIPEKDLSHPNELPNEGRSLSDKLNAGGAS
jgi:hypothetical protein